MLRNFKVVLIALAILIIAGSAYAFAAANSIPTPGYAGSGESDVSGYTVSNIEFTFDTNDPTQVTQIEFDLNHAARIVRIQTDATLDPNWDLADCTADGSNHVTCVPANSAPSWNTVDINKLNVAASS